MRQLLIVGALLLALVAAEGLARWSPDGPATRLLMASHGQYPGLLAHPQLQAVPSGRLWSPRGAAAVPIPPSYEPDLEAIRVVLLGGSASFGAFEQALALALQGDGGGPHVQLLSLAAPGHSSAHAVLNLAINGLALRPSFVIFRPGSEDVRAWGFGEGFRPDYAHVLRPMAPPHGVEVEIVRRSALYRWLRVRVGAPPAWLHWQPYRPSPSPTDQPNERELAALLRNIELVGEIASSRGAKTVLVTGAEGEAQPAAIDAALRAVAGERGGELILVDGGTAVEELVGLIRAAVP